MEITCIQEWKDPSDTTPKKHEDCEPVKNVFKNSWMPDVVNAVKPQKILEYKYDLGYLYIFQKADARHLYDCLGNKMCDTDDNGDCSSLISTIGKGKVIQVLRN